MNQKIGKYRVVRKLGQGAMGSVFAAVDDATAKRVALKVINSQLSLKKSISERFRREIALCKEFAHPYVIKILDGGIDKASGCPFLAMELLDGTALSDLACDRPLNQKDALHIFSQQAEALEYIHSKGILHRDIKPDNIFVLYDGRSILLDFGLALKDELTRMSATSDRPGTMITMSPEQLRGDELKGTSDIYNLGMTMYMAVTGITPYTIEEIVEIASGIVPKLLRPPCEVNSLVDENLSTLILNCLRIDAKKRYQSAAEVKKAVSLVQQGKPAPAPKVPMDGQSSSENAVSRSRSGKFSSVSSSGSVSSVKVGSTPYMSRRWVRGSISCLVVLLCILTVWYTASDPTPEVSSMTSVTQQSSDTRISSELSLLTSEVFSPLKTGKKDAELKVWEIPPEDIVRWMKKVTEVSQLPHSESVGALRESSGLMANVSLGVFLDGARAQQSGNFLDAARKYRESVQSYLNQCFVHAPQLQNHNPVAEYILGLIASSLHPGIVDEQTLFTVSECRKWYDFRMVLPVQELLSGDAEYLRKLSFVSWARLVKDRIPNPEFQEIIQSSLPSVLASKPFALLTSQQRQHIVSLLVECGFAASLQPATKNVPADEHRMAKKSRPDEEMTDFIDRLLKENRMLFNKQGAKLYYQKSAEFFTYLWLIYADIEANPSYIYKRWIAVFSGENTPLAFVHGPFWAQFKHMQAMERLRYMQFVSSKTEASVAGTWKIGSEKERKKILYSIYVQIGTFLSETKGNISAADQRIWEAMAAMYPKSSQLYWHIIGHLCLSRLDVKGALEALGTFVSLTEDAVKGSSDEDDVSFELWKLHRYVCEVLSELFKIYPETYDVTFLKKIPSIVSDMESKLGTEADPSYWDERRAGWLKNMRILSSFCLHLSNDGASVSDLNRLTNNIFVIYTTNMHFDELRETLKSMVKLNPEKPWELPITGE